jgi:glutamate formiminotransferase/formiminotetrahydrofolate cyclodeaminase
LEHGFEHELDLRQTLESLAAPRSAPAGGSAAALCGALAAAVTVKVARLSEQAGLAAQAAALGARLADLAPSDALAFAAARAALSTASEGGDERRDFALGRVLDRSSAVPLEIAEACADVAAVAGELARTGHDDTRPDAAVAAVLAAAAAHAAVRLVEVNLAVGADDARAKRARAAAQTASDAAQLVL